MVEPKSEEISSAPRLPWHQAMGQGFVGLWQTRRMVFPVYLVNLATALVAILPVYLTLHRLTARRPAAQRLLQTWDLEVLIELLMDNPALVQQLKGVFLFVPLFYLLVSQLLVGGVLGALDRPGDRPTLRSFGRDALGFFPGLFWVGVWSVIPYAVAGFALVLPLAVAVDLESSTLVTVLCCLPGLLLLAWVDAGLDFARASTICGEVTPSPKRVLYGLWTVLKRPVASALVHLGFGLVGLLPLLVLLLLPDSLDAGSTGAILGAFLLRQVIVLVRVALRIASLGGHLQLYRSIFPAS